MNKVLNNLEKLKKEAVLREKFKKTPSVDCGDGVYRYFLENAGVADFEDTVRQLKEAYGESCIFERSVCENRYFGVQNSDGYIYVSYISCRKLLSVYYADGKRLMPEIMSEKSEYKGKKTFTQISPTDPMDLPSAETNFGMCYIFALGEGHFLMYDGLGDRQNDDEKIIASLMRSTPKGQKPIIDAWIITHAHFDHVAGIKKLAEKYSEDIEVRNFIMNMPDAARYDMSVANEATACYRIWLPTIFERFPQASVWKAHTGQKFLVGGAEVEILYTQEEYFTERLMKLNDASVVSRVSFGGKSFMIVADIETEEPCVLLHDMYGSYLKSDYYQSAHHGWSAEALYFYYDVDPEFILFTARLRHWNNKDRFWQFPATKVIKEDMESGRRTVYPSIAEDIIIEF